MRKVLISLILLVALVIFLLGFIDRSYLEPVKSSADITYSVNNIPKDLKAIGDLNIREQDIICAISRGLIDIDLNGKITPELAESVDIRDDGIEYEFKIRNDVYWSDGSKITPKDIVMFFREVITEEQEKNIEAMLNVFGAKEYKTSNKSFSEQVGITSSDNSVIIRLNAPDSNFLRELSKPQYRVRKNVLLWENIKNNYNNLIYSGNYSISDIEDNQIVLNRNTKSDVKLAQTIHVVKDDGEDLALAAFEIGNRDVVVNPPKSQLERLNKEDKLITVPSNRGLYLLFNQNNDSIPVMGKREIYRWLSKALEQYQLENKEAIELAEGSYFRSDNENLEKLQSRKVWSNLDEEWQIPNEITLIAEDNLQNKDMLNFITKWFSENTDVTLNTSLVNKGDITSAKDKTYYDLAIMDFTASVSNKAMFYNEINDYLPSNLSDKVITGISKEEEEIIFTQIEDTLFNTYSILPLIFYNENIAINTSIKNISLDGNGNIIFNMIKK